MKIQNTQLQMKLTEEDVEFEWEAWGESKPWICPLCKSFLSSGTYTECDGTDPYIPESDWTPHEVIQACAPLTKEQFAVRLLEQHEQMSLEMEEEAKNEAS